MLMYTWFIRVDVWRQHTAEALNSKSKGMIIIIIIQSNQNIVNVIYIFDVLPLYTITVDFKSNH